jgi:tetratricopeptide (TPR) repeat protein
MTSAANDHIPSDREVKRQLERMVSGERFASLPRQAAFLSLVVKKTLKGDEIDEDILGYELFRNYVADRSTDVRANANHLRASLTDYYAEEGLWDLVVISLPVPPRGKRYRTGKKRTSKGKLPQGTPYKPFFAYNKRHPAEQDYRRALYYLGQCAPGDDGIALDYFGDVLKKIPSYSPAHVGKAEVFLRWAMYYHSRLTPAESLKLAEKHVLKGLQCNPKSWRAHAVQGAIHCCYQRWKEAKRSFTRALRRDAFHTRYGNWYYPAFLMATGKSSEALSLALTRAQENPDDHLAHLVHGAFLHAGRRFDDAFLALTIALTMQPRSWAIHTIAALNDLARGEPDKAAASIVRVYQLTGEELFPGLLILCLASAIRLRRTPEKQSLARRLGTDELFSEVYASIDAMLDALPTPQKQFAQVKRQARKRYIAPLQLAVAELGMNDAKSALKELKRASFEHHPLMAWLRLWPIFDALRERKEFQRLIEAMELPASR